VDLDSLKAYEASMNEEGAHRHTPTKYKR